MDKYIYNITFHVSKAVSKEVLEYIKTSLIPIWNGYSHWDTPRLMRVHTPQEDVEAFALQYEIKSIDRLSEFNEHTDKALLLLLDAYPQKVMPFSVVMQEEVWDA